MRLYPAIDIKDGKCVRLCQGDFSNSKTYYENPYEVAKMWEDSGAEFIHCVDLDGALVGNTKNRNAIEKIVNAVNIPVQLGGGIRSKENVKNILDLGVSRVIIGTKAVENPEYLKELVNEFSSDKIVVGIDAKQGKVAIHGWEVVSDMDAIQLALVMKDMGVKTIVYTDISKDGMLIGPDFESTKKMAQETRMDIIASGGVSCIDDLVKLKSCNVEGAIIGKALYENRINLKEALEKLGKGN